MNEIVDAIKQLHQPIEGWRECEHNTLGEWCPSVEIGKHGPCCGDDPAGDYSRSGSSQGGRIPVPVCGHCLVGWVGADLPDDIDREAEVAWVGDRSDGWWHRVWPCPTVQLLNPEAPIG